jgi:ferredoxin/flavodoxin---NADP+ reductase
MSSFNTERVLRVRHWNESLFSFSTTRNPGLRFENGQFLMIGLPIDGRPLVRAYSIASANHEEHLEFFSIKVADGALTSRLQHLLPGQELLVSRKPTGTLLLDDLRPAKNLYLLSSGTGLAPFLSLVKDPSMYERFEKIVLVHSVRATSELAYEEYLSHVLPKDEHIGEWVSKQLIYYPTVTREPYRNRGRLTDLIESGKLFEAIGLPPLSVANDRVMICGSPSMLKDVSTMLDARGFHISPHIGSPGDYVIERAFVEK